MRRIIFLGLVALAGLGVGSTYWVAKDPARCASLPDYFRALICTPDVIGSQAFKKGQFLGPLEVRFFSSMSGDGKPVELVQLLKPFGYKDSKGVEWVVPEGFLSDGASIPDALWVAVGGPYSGPYRDAAVVHDYYCFTKSRPWQDVHDVFLEAALNRGTTEWKAQYMYAGILLKGPRWDGKGSNLIQKGFARAQIIPTQGTPAAPATAPTKIPPPAGKTDAQIFQELQDWIQKEKPTRDQIRQRIETIRKSQGVPTTK
ncbi:MAG: DUF1353 domain-containing protein [Hyphomicrobiaceae bacterium]